MKYIIKTNSELIAKAKTKSLAKSIALALSTDFDRRALYDVYGPKGWITSYKNGH